MLCQSGHSDKNDENGLKDSKQNQWTPKFVYNVTVTDMYFEVNPIVTFNIYHKSGAKSSKVRHKTKIRNIRYITISQVVSSEMSPENDSRFFGDLIYVCSSMAKEDNS